MKVKAYRFSWATTLALLAAFLLVGEQAWGQTKLLRFPDLHGDQVAFGYAGDLWTAPAEGGTARRLTSHEGIEIFPKFSPDGRWIAFTGQYDGDEQVYVMPAQGGVPKQLTFYPARGPLPPRWGYDNIVYGWTPDGNGVLFRSLREEWSLAGGRLFTVSVEGGLPQALPMPTAGAGDFSPDGTKMVYSPLFRDFRSWKRYQGGWAQDLQIIDLESLETTPVTQHERSDRDPMWGDGVIYFASDRDGTLNLYAYDVDSGDLSQLTRSTTWDVRWPSKSEDDRIVYELAGELHILDASSGDSRKVEITVPYDGLAMRPERTSAADVIENFGLSPKGERALFAARGDIFTAPVEHGPTRNLTRSSGAHDKAPDWSPDGSRIVFISDLDGEEELYLVSQDGKDEPQQVTDGNEAMLYSPQWSPDGKHIAYSDKEGRIFVLAVEDRSVQRIADEKGGQVPGYQWSPKGRYLSFALSDPSGFTSIYIWDSRDSRLHRVTGEFFNEFSPAWDPAGNYLFYLSDRMFQPQIGSFEWNYMVDRESGIYALALREDVKSLFPPRSDEVTVEEKEGQAEESSEEEMGGKKGASQDEAGESGPEEGEAAMEAAESIDFEGLAQRVERVPVDLDNYAALSAVKGHLIYVRTGPFYYGRASDIPPGLKIYSLKDRKESDLMQPIAGYALSADNSKLLVRQGNDFQLLAAAPEGPKSAKSVSTDGLEVDRVPKLEWEQIFDEVWRRYRDFFYVENMHGYDWQGLREQYRPLLEHVAHRSDLNYVISEMIAELNVGHAYISGGDWKQPERPLAALAGARFQLDPQAGRYRIATILGGHNEEDLYRSPLTEVGVEVQEGDYLLAVDGQEVQAGDNPYEVLLHKYGHPVTWTVADSPEGQRRDVTYSPIRHERDLVYLNWVEDNRRKVSQMSGGRVGYLHIPDMGANGIREFIKWYYGQIRKEGLVIDVRSNGGGNVSQMLIERLRRELLHTGYARTSDYTGTYPSVVFHGHLVCLLNETSASDGDIFPAMFREAGLGPLIGKRSWGGVIGITSRGTLIDGGGVNVPEFGYGSKEGEWTIEGYGVDPDIVVENSPKDLIEGRDAQLERALEEVLRRIEENPMKLPDRPAAPVRTP
ncbi:MAG TPA: S41 family peptidase [Acidobacteriota bacterium]|nr:S41 family peptidase [Acidobacteriota bacterium]